MQPDKAEAVLEGIRTGLSQNKACQAAGISDTSFSRWCDENAELAGKYARACEERGIVLAEQALEIADNKDIPSDQKRIMVDTRKWFASKLHAKRFGDKVDHNHGGKIEHGVTLIERRIVKHDLLAVENKSGE